MRVMGIDPGSLCTGYGIVEEAGGGLIPVHFGSIKSKSKTPFAHRLKTIYDGLIAVLEDYRPDAVAVEDIFSRSTPNRPSSWDRHAGSPCSPRSIPISRWRNTHRWR